MGQTMNIGSARVGRGQSGFGWIPVTRRSSGEMLSIGVHIVNGAEDGPVLGLFATSHGDEAYAIEVIRAAIQRLDPSAFRGAVVAIPVANPVAFESFTRATGQGMNTDKNNMNRVFPGSPDGWLTEQLAYAVSTGFLSRLDCLIDFHCGGMETAIDYMLIEDRADAIGEQELRLSKLYGTDLLFLMEKRVHSGTVTQYAHEQGIPAIVAELGGCFPLGNSYLDRCVQGVLNVMIGLGMIGGEAVLPREQVLMRDRALVRPRNGGLFIPEVGFDMLGQAVPKNAMLGRVISPHSFEELEVLKAPYEETVLIMLRGVLSRVNPGDYGYILGDRGTADVISNA
jgi:predicted deacylase